jgi:high-affinity K+ transport system ATPase subunit B
MDKILEFLRTWFVSVYKMTDTEVSSLFNEENFDPTAALTAIKEKDTKRVASFSGKFQEGINKGKADALKTLETELKAKYGIEDDPEHPLQGAALVDAIVAAKAGETVTGEVSKLTAEDIRKLPAFQTIQREHSQPH